MKQLILVGALAFTAAAFGGTKIGTVDMMTLVRNHPSYESNKNLLTSTERDYQKKLDALKAELDAIQEEGKKMYEEYRNPMLSQTAKQKIESDMVVLQNRLMAAQGKLRNEAMRNQQELADLEARLLKAQAEDIRARVAKFAEKENYDFILDASAALYSKKSANVTDEILTAMGVDPKAVKEKAEKEKTANESK